MAGHSSGLREIEEEQSCKRLKYKAEPNGGLHSCLECERCSEQLCWWRDGISLIQGGEAEELSGGRYLDV